jgi:hypothetical protein
VRLFGQLDECSERRCCNQHDCCRLSCSARATRCAQPVGLHHWLHVEIDLLGSVQALHRELGAVAYDCPTHDGAFDRSTRMGECPYLQRIVARAQGHCEFPSGSCPSACTIRRSCVPRCHRRGTCRKHHAQRSLDDRPKQRVPVAAGGVGAVPRLSTWCITARHAPARWNLTPCTCREILHAARKYLQQVGRARPGRQSVGRGFGLT